MFFFPSSFFAVVVVVVVVLSWTTGGGLSDPRHKRTWGMRINEEEMHNKLSN